jgi:hypothetical protein
MLAGHGFVCWVEDVFFQLRMSLKRRKDLLGNHLLGAEISCTRMPGQEVMDKLVISFEQSKGIARLLGHIVSLDYGVSSVRVSCWKVAGAALVSLCRGWSASAVPRQGMSMQERGEGGGFSKRGSPLNLFWCSAFCSPQYAFLYSLTSDEVMPHITPVLRGVWAQDRGIFMGFTPSLRMPTIE